MSSDISRNLTKFELFQGLSDDVLDQLAGKITALNLQKNDVLFHQGDPGDAIYLIRSGWVKIINEEADDGEVVLNHVGPGGIIGEMAMFDQSPRSGGVVAISEVVLLKLLSEDFMSLLDEQPGVSIPIIHSLSSRLEFSTTYIENAIEWSKRIAAGDYNFAQERMQIVQSTIVDSKQPDEERANRFLGTFFRMVEGVKAREEELQGQLEQLRIEIDNAQRKQAVADLVDSDFFLDLKKKSAEMRQRFADED